MVPARHARSFGSGQASFDAWSDRYLEDVQINSFGWASVSLRLRSTIEISNVRQDDDDCPPVRNCICRGGNINLNWTCLRIRCDALWKWEISIMFYWILKSTIPTPVNLLQPSVNFHPSSEPFILIRALPETQVELSSTNSTFYCIHTARSLRKVTPPKVRWLTLHSFSVSQLHTGPHVRSGKVSFGAKKSSSCENCVHAQENSWEVLEYMWPPKRPSDAT